MGETTGELTAWLVRAATGDSEAERHLVQRWRPLLASMLRTRLAGGAAASLADAGALVQLSWRDRLAAHELVAADRALYIEWAARLMQNLALELAGRSGVDTGKPAAPARASKRVTGGASLPDDAPAAMPTLRALADLASLDLRLARVVRLRWFAALSLPEIAEQTGTDEMSVQRDWLKARAFLLAAMPDAPVTPGKPPAPPVTKRRGGRKRSPRGPGEAKAA